jgi:hypothetical protein
MSKNSMSYRKLVADALSPKPSNRNADVLIVTNLQFEPSLAALQKVDEDRRRIRAEITAECDI